MKKILSIIFCILLTFSLFACNTNQGNNSSDNGENSSDTQGTTSLDNGGNSSTEGATSSGGGTVEPPKPAKDYEVTVTLDGDYSGVDFSDTKLVAYKYTFSSLKTDLRDVDSELKEAKLVDGKTVLIFKASEVITNGRALTYAPTKSTQAEKDTLVTQAENAVTWQLDNGGWDKDYKGHIANAFAGTTDLQKITKGWTKNGAALGTIDNDGTYSEMRLIAEAYNYNSQEKFKKSFLKGFEFLKKLQTEKGGFTQVYPKRGNYSDYVTYNDEAMAAVMRLLYDIKVQKFPFTSTFIDDTTRKSATEMLNKAVDYTLKAQIMSNGEYSGWCSQHDPKTYEPKKGRDFEPVSISSSESFGVIKVLLTSQDNVLAIERAEKAIEYFKKVALYDTGYNNVTAPYFTEQKGKTIWYRFYEINTNKGVFGDRDKTVHYDLGEISEERRTGYSWAGDYGSKLIRVYSEHGFYEDKVMLSVPTEKKGANSTIKAGTKINL